MNGRGGAERPEILGALIFFFPREKTEENGEGKGAL